jgi:CRP-like cAMP-binding protein
MVMSASETRGIQTGKVRLTVVSSDGTEATIGILGDGEFFGEGVALLQMSAGVLHRGKRASSYQTPRTQVGTSAFIQAGGIS